MFSSWVLGAGLGGGREVVSSPEDDSFFSGHKNNLRSNRRLLWCSFMWFLHDRKLVSKVFLTEKQSFAAAQQCSMLFNFKMMETRSFFLESNSAVSLFCCSILQPCQTYSFPDLQWVCSGSIFVWAEIKSCPPTSLTEEKEHDM